VKTGLNIVGVIVGLVGLVWVLQGVGILPGSFMSGDSKWAIIGIVALVIGAALLVYNNRRPTSAA
jgi:hypothetical protein